MPILRVFSIIWTAALVIVSLAAHAAEIKVLSDGPVEPALVRITEAFRRDTGHEVKFVFGLSPVIHKLVMDGQAADVAIIQPNFLDELVKAGKVPAGEHPVIARVGVGLFTRPDSPAEPRYQVSFLAAPRKCCAVIAHASRGLLRGHLPLPWGYPVGATTAGLPSLTDSLRKRRCYGERVPETAVSRCSNQA